MRERLKECHRVLKKTGSLFLHCDTSASHYLRVLLDEVFGYSNFRSEIIWTYRRWSNSKKGLLDAHQTIYFYSKTGYFKFNMIYCGYSPTTNIDQILQKRRRDENGKVKYLKNEKGNPVLAAEKKGVPLSDVWEIPFLNPKAKERAGYPTQKPILLLERIINLATDEGGVVLDPFCGSGTTLVAAKLLNRRFVGMDISFDAVELAKHRLSHPVKSESLLMKMGEGAYLNKSASVIEILKRIGAVPVQRNRGIDGFLQGHNFSIPIPVKMQGDNESLSDAIARLIAASQKRGCLKKVLIKSTHGQRVSLFDEWNSYVDKDLIIVENIDKFVEQKETLLSKEVNEVVTV